MNEVIINIRYELENGTRGRRVSKDVQLIVGYADIDRLDQVMSSWLSEVQTSIEEADRIALREFEGEEREA